MPEGLEISDGGFDEQVAAPPSSSSSKKKVIIGATILAIVAAVAIAIGIVVGGSSSNKSNEETVSISAMKNGHVFSAYEDHVDLPFETRSHDSSHSYSRSQKPSCVCPAEELDSYPLLVEVPGGEPPGECEGDCKLGDEDNCGEGLTCFRRYSVPQSVPGCRSIGSEIGNKTDVCVKTEYLEDNCYLVGLKSSDNSIRQQCQGGCNDNDDDKRCEDGLECFKRPEGNSTVPGCCGYSSELNFCVHPDEV